MNYLTLFVFSLNIITTFSAVISAQSEDCKNVEDFFNSYKLSANSDMKVPACCDDSDKYHYIKCENGHITDIQLRYNSRNERIDFSTFPMLPNLESILLEGPMLKDGAFPSRFTEFPKMKSLQVLSSNVENVPSFSSCSLETLSIYNNPIVGFPESFFNCKKLKHLNVSKDPGVGEIPKGLGDMKDLEILYLGQSGLTSISDDISSLKLKELDLDGNPNLSSTVSFENSVDYCDFRDSPKITYVKGSCKEFITTEVPTRQTLSEEEGISSNYVKNVSESTSRGVKSGGSKIIFIVIGGVVALIVIGVAICCCMRRGKSDDSERYVVDRSRDTPANENKSSFKVNIPTTSGESSISPVSPVKSNTTTSTDLNVDLPDTIEETSSPAVKKHTGKEAMTSAVISPVSLSSDNNNVDAPNEEGNDTNEHLHSTVPLGHNNESTTSFKRIEALQQTSNLPPTTELPPYTPPDNIAYTTSNTQSNSAMDNGNMNQDSNNGLSPMSQSVPNSSFVSYSNMANYNTSMGMDMTSFNNGMDMNMTSFNNGMDMNMNNYNNGMDMNMNNYNNGMDMNMNSFNNGMGMDMNNMMNMNMNYNDMNMNMNMMNMNMNMNMNNYNPQYMNFNMNQQDQQYNQNNN